MAALCYFASESFTDWAYERVANYETYQRLINATNSCCYIANMRKTVDVMDGTVTILSMYASLHSYLKLIAGSNLLV